MSTTDHGTPHDAADATDVPPPTAPPASDHGVIRRGLRLLWRSVRTHPRPFAVAVTGAAVFGMVTVVMTIVLGRVTDDLIIPAFQEGRPATGMFVGAVGAILGVSVLRAGGVVVRRYFGAMTTYRMQRTWRERVADRYVDVPLSFHHERPSGQLLAHADTDVEVSTEVMMPLPLTTGTVVLAVTALVSLAVVDLWLMLVAIVLFPLLVAVNRIYTAKVEEPAALVQARAGGVSSVAHESFEGALVVKTLGLEASEVARMDRATERLRQARVRVGTLRATFEPVIDGLPNLGMVALLAVGSWRISVEAVTTGQVVQALALFGVLVFPMRVAGYLLEELPRSAVAADRLHHVLTGDVDLDLLSGRDRLPDGPLGVEVEHLTFGYEEEAVLDDVDLGLAPGETVALVGPTGAGKSTLCTLLAGLVEPWSGTIRLGGVDLRHASGDDVRAAVGMVFQETYLFADTVRENLTLGAAVDDGELDEALRIARAEFARSLPNGLDTVVGERGITLSGGQRQRLALARALLRGPRLLLLDDATSAIDPVIEADILRNLRGDRGATLLLVAHRLATIRLADRVLFLHGGRIAAEGHHDDLLAVPEYRALARAYEQADPA